MVVLQFILTEAVLTFGLRKTTELVQLSSAVCTSFTMKINEIGCTDNNFASLKLPLESRCCQVFLVFAEFWGSLEMLGSFLRQL